MWTSDFYSCGISGLNTSRRSTVGKSTHYLSLQLSSWYTMYFFRPSISLCGGHLILPLASGYIARDCGSEFVISGLSSQPNVRKPRMASPFPCAIPPSELGRHRDDKNSINTSWFEVGRKEWRAQRSGK